MPIPGVILSRYIGDKEGVYKFWHKLASPEMPVPLRT